jgi:hypothetical protein
MSAAVDHGFHGGKADDHWIWKAPAASRSDPYALGTDVQEIAPDRQGIAADNRAIETDRAVVATDKRAIATKKAAIETDTQEIASVSVRRQARLAKLRNTTLRTPLTAGKSPLRGAG